jgi:hypothetical protein
MAENTRQTGEEAASAASGVLRDPDASGSDKAAAGSALSQTPSESAPNNANQTSEDAASSASSVLRDPDASGSDKKAAGSAHSQTPSKAD